MLYIKCEFAKYASVFIGQQNADVSLCDKEGKLCKLLDNSGGAYLFSICYLNFCFLLYFILNVIANFLVSVKLQIDIYVICWFIDWFLTAYQSFKGYLMPLY